MKESERANPPEVDILEDLGGDPTDEQLRQLSDLVQLQIKLEDQARDLEHGLTLVKRELQTMSGETIPNLMDEIGMRSFTLLDGGRVEVKRHVKASIRKDNRDPAHAWLRANGHGSLIKNEVTASFVRGEEQKATDFYTACVDAGRDMKRKESVHAQTLSAFVREQLEAGEDLPMDLLGVFEYSETKIIRT